MEYVSAILYHKIQDSDFTNMYGIKKPTSGGGQTYIQAAGYERHELDKMFESADTIINTIEYWDSEKKYPRKKYIFPATAIGLKQTAKIELAPRTGRKDYRISRQNLKHRHPAWSAVAGFPEPLLQSATSTDSGGTYHYQKNYPGIIDNLYIYILKTISENGDSKFYASYINTDKMPNNWPIGVGLEQIFKKQTRQGILFFDEQFIRFENNQECPFAAGCAADPDIDNVILPSDLAVSIDDAVEYANKSLAIEIDFNNVKFEHVPAPITKRKPKNNAGKRVNKDTDYTRRQKNKKKIGDIGEKLVMQLEYEKLINLGQKNLADKIKHVSKTEGDGLGYDIVSYEKIGGTFKEIYIEVKTTTGNINKPFDISANEVEVSELYSDRYYIYRLFNIHNGMTTIPYYKIKGSVKEHFMLEATSFKAYPKSTI
ncbi:MAG: DUF3883 domain-containing protein [Lachnospiraceae bacterium]|nr:DUF3883 domain-containing protein [Lachnospiraceae bacterium]